LILECDRKARANREKIEAGKILEQPKQNGSYSLVMDGIRTDGSVSEITKKVNIEKFEK